MNHFDGSSPWLEPLANWRDGDLDCQISSLILTTVPVKNQVADALSRFKTKDDYKTPLDDEVPGFTIPEASVSCAPQTEATNFESIKESKGPSVPFIREFCMMVGITCNDKGKIPSLDEIISAQSNDPYFRSTFAYVRKPNTLFNAESDGVLVSVSPLNGASQRVVPVSIRPRFLHLSHYSLLAGHPGQRWMYDCMRKKL